jgi:glutathione S-transferase
MLVPSLQHNGIKVWDTLAIGEYLQRDQAQGRLLPADVKARAHCRAICGEMHSGFASMRGALPMNIKAHFPELQGVVARAGRHRPRAGHLEGMPGHLWRPLPVWQAPHGGRCHVCAGGDALHDLRRAAGQGLQRAYCKRIMELPAMQEWVAAAKKEPDEIDELDAEF